MPRIVDADDLHKLNLKGAFKKNSLHYGSPASSFWHERADDICKKKSIESLNLIKEGFATFRQVASAFNIPIETLQAELFEALSTTNDSIAAAQVDWIFEQSSFSRDLLRESIIYASGPGFDNLTINVLCFFAWRCRKELFREEASQ